MALWPDAALPLQSLTGMAESQSQTWAVGTRCSPGVSLSAALLGYLSDLVSVQTYHIKNSKLLAMEPHQGQPARSGSHIRFGALECRIDLNGPGAQVLPSTVAFTE